MSFLLGAPALYRLPVPSPLTHPPPQPSPARIVCIAVSPSGRLLCVASTVSVWLYSLLQPDCVALGGWKRTPAMQSEEGHNLAVAFNHLSQSQPRRSPTPSPTSPPSSPPSPSSLPLPDPPPVDPSEDDEGTTTVLAILTSRHIVDILRVAERPDLCQPSSRSHPPSPHHSSAPAPSSSSLSTSALSRLAAPPVHPVSCATSPALFGFPSAVWHDELTLSACVHHPVTMHLVARVKLSNDDITAIAACADGFLLGTNGGFVQRVQLDGQPVSCVHLPSQIVPAVPEAVRSAAVLDLCVEQSLSVLAFVLHDGRAGVCDAAVMGPGMTRSPRSKSGATAWLTSSSESDSAVCVAISRLSRSLAVGRTSGSVDVYHLDAARHGFVLRRSIAPPGRAGSTSASAVSCVAFSAYQPTLAVTWADGSLRLLDIHGHVLTDSGSAQSSDAGTPPEKPSSATSSSLPPSSSAVPIPRPSLLCWSRCGYSLLTLPRSSSSSASSSDELTFARYPCYHILRSDSASPHVSLLGHDRLLISRQLPPKHVPGRRGPASGRSKGATFSSAFSFPAAGEESTDGGGDDEATDAAGEREEPPVFSSDPYLSPSFDSLLADWDVIVPPASYTSHAAPLLHAAVSHSGDHVALSGTRGVCVFNRRTRKWRTFGNVHEEWRVRPRGLHWYGEHTLVVSNVLPPQQHADALQTVAAERVQELGHEQPRAAASVHSDAAERSSVLFIPRSHLSFGSVLRVLVLPAGTRLLNLDVQRHSLVFHLDRPRLLLHLRLSCVLKAPSTSKRSLSVTRKSLGMGPSASTPSLMSTHSNERVERAISDPMIEGSSLPLAQAHVKYGTPSLTATPEGSPPAVPMPSDDGTVSPLDSRRSSVSSPFSSGVALPASSSTRSLSSATGLEVASIACRLLSSTRIDGVEDGSAFQQLTLWSQAGFSVVIALSYSGRLWQCALVAADGVDLTSAMLAEDVSAFLLPTLTPSRWSPPPHPSALNQRLLSLCRLVTVGHDGLSMWLPSSVPDSTPTPTRLPLEGTHLYPLAVTLTGGYMLTARASAASPGEHRGGSSLHSAPSFTLSCRRLPFLQAPFEASLLSSPGPFPELACALASACHDPTMLASSLELLVHSAVHSGKASPSVLSSVLRFLRLFPDLHALTLATVARKNDASLWPRLFPSLDASPHTLALHCLISGDVHTAALFLLMVQRTESPLAAYQLAHRLLQQVERQRVALLGQLSVALGEAGGVVGAEVGGAEWLERVEGLVELEAEVRRFLQQTRAILEEQRAALEDRHVDKNGANAASHSRAPREPRQEDSHHYGGSQAHESEPSATPSDGTAASAVEDGASTRSSGSGNCYVQ